MEAKKRGKDNDHPKPKVLAAVLSKWHQDASLKHALYLVEDASELTHIKSSLPF